MLQLFTQSLNSEEEESEEDNEEVSEFTRRKRRNGRRTIFRKNIPYLRPNWEGRFKKRTERLRYFNCGLFGNFAIECRNNKNHKRAGEGGNKYERSDLPANVAENRKRDRSEAEVESHEFGSAVNALSELNVRDV